MNNFMPGTRYVALIIYTQWSWPFFFSVFVFVFLIFSVFFLRHGPSPPPNLDSFLSFFFTIFLQISKGGMPHGPTSRFCVPSTPTPTYHPPTLAATTVLRSRGEAESRGAAARHLGHDAIVLVLCAGCLLAGAAPPMLQALPVQPGREAGSRCGRECCSPSAVLSRRRCEHCQSRQAMEVQWG